MRAATLRLILDASVRTWSLRIFSKPTWNNLNAQTVGSSYSYPYQQQRPEESQIIHSARRRQRPRPGNLVSRNSPWQISSHYRSSTFIFFFLKPGYQQDHLYYGATRKNWVLQAIGRSGKQRSRGTSNGAFESQMSRALSRYSSR